MRTNEREKHITQIEMSKNILKSGRPDIKQKAIVLK